MGRRRRPNLETQRAALRRRLHPAAREFLYGEPRAREESPVTAQPAEYDGTHRDGCYRLRHDEEKD